MISVYRPCKANKVYNSAYMQHFRYSMKKRGGICPRDTLFQDLHVELMKWKQNGDGLIVVGDFNEDVRSKSMSNWKDRLGLYDVMLEKCLELAVTPLNTYNWGTVPLDTIICTTG